MRFTIQRIHLLHELVKNQLVVQRGVIHFRLYILFVNSFVCPCVPSLQDGNTKKVSVSSIVDPLGNTKVTNNPVSPPRFSYAEVPRISLPSGVSQTTLSTSPKNINKNNKSASTPNSSGVPAGHHAGQVEQAAHASVVTPSTFSPQAAVKIRA